MTTIENRISEIQKSALPSRLLRGAEILGRLYRAGQRCLSGWSRICPCQTPTDFCQAKVKWVQVNDEYYDGPPFGLAGHEPYYVIEAMRVSQFRALGLTTLVHVPTRTVIDGTGGVGVVESETIRVGVKGTTWKTLLDLAALQDDDAALAVAVDAVVKLQKADRR
jgi:hypothetical protein